MTTLDSRTAATLAAGAVVSAMTTNTPIATSATDPGRVEQPLWENFVAPRPIQVLIIGLTVGIASHPGPAPAVARGGAVDGL
jgi:hypothetical protein